tara:strand:- start:2279 stop:3058 length:780 start_codon:yes stop_codon:yes gene_type:complete
MTNIKDAEEFTDEEIEKILSENDLRYLTEQIKDFPGLDLILINPISQLFNNQLGFLVNEVRAIPGDIVELGVHTGNNATQFLWHMPEKKYFGFDTFTGYTKKDMDEDPESDSLKSNMKENRWVHDKQKTVERIEDFNKKINQIARILLNRQDMSFSYDFEIIKGDIKRTVPKAVKEGNMKEVAFLYVDCNAYLPAIKGIEAIYPILSDGGMICIDEHKDGGETKALNEIAEKYGLKVEETGFQFETSVHSNPSKYIVKK